MFFQNSTFFDSKGRITVPIIIEVEKNKIFMLSRDLIDLIVSYIKTEINIESLKHEYSFKDNSQALIILYHEIIWDIMNILEQKNIIKKPILFKNPEKAQSKDVSDIIFFVINN